MLSQFLRASQPAARLTRFLLTFCLAAGTAAPILGQDAVWGERFGFGYTTSDSTGLDVAPVPDGSGDFYACGIVDAPSYVFGDGTTNVLSAGRESGGYQDVFVARYHSDGVPVWVRYGRGPANDRPRALATLSSGAVHVVGEYDLNQNGVPTAGIDFDTDDDDPATTPDVHLRRLCCGQTGAFIACYEPDGC